MEHKRHSKTLYPGLVGLLVALSAGSAGSALAAEAPVALSPGGASKAGVVEARCPTFSWGGVEGATGYELVVYRQGEERESDKEAPVLQRSFSDPVKTWTPSLEDCLERGARYTWAVRAVVSEEVSPWSSARIFEVAAAPGFEKALRLVQQALGEDPASSTTPPPGARFRAGPTTAALSGGSTPESAGDPDLMVNGSPVVTAATFAAGVACWSVVPGIFYRYVDLKDGTVLDCNTRKIWLKDASCLGAGTWDSFGGAGSVQAILADLNDRAMGSDFGCEDYTDGTYTDWELPTIADLCSAGAVNQVCPPVNASDSLIDSSVTTMPKIVNASGDAGWTTNGDAFAGVPPASGYWSATEAGLDAWIVGLGDGAVLPSFKDNTNSVWPVRNAD